MNRKPFWFVSAAILLAAAGAFAQDPPIRAESGVSAQGSAVVNASTGSAASSDVQAGAASNSEGAAGLRGDGARADAAASHTLDSMAKGRARLVRGELGPKSKPNDEVVFRLEEDVKSGNGTILPKGSEVKGVVQSVEEAEVHEKNGARTSRSLIHVLWQASDSHGAGGDAGAPVPTNITMDALTFVHPFARTAAESPDAFDFGAPAGGIQGSGGAGGGLLGSASGGIVNSTAGIAGGIEHSVGGSVGALGGLDAGGIVSRDLGPTALDSSTAGSIAGALDLNRTGQLSTLYQLGQGMVITSRGEGQQMDLMTTFAGDSILATGKNAAQVTSGAEARMLFGIR